MQNQGIILDVNIFKYVDATHSYSAGEVIFRQGDTADGMFVVKSGSVSIDLNGEIIEVITEGGIFGEMALVDNSSRSATATATTDCELLFVDENGFKKHVNSTPHFGLQVLRVTVKRLRKMMHRGQEK